MMNEVWKKARPWVIFLAVALVLFWVIREDWARTSVVTDTVSPKTLAGEAGGTLVLQEKVRVPMDVLKQVEVAAVIADGAEGEVRLTLTDGDGQDVFDQSYPFASLRTGERAVLPVGDWEGRAASPVYTLRLEADPGFQVWTGDSVQTGRFDIRAGEDCELTVNGQEREGQAVLALRGYSRLQGTALYWPCVAALALGAAAVCAVTERQKKKGKMNALAQAQDITHRYFYLLKQLVVRDFKVKYKASLLGVLWSFLNPLLMTLVYHLVFSTLFHSDISNFVIYLMSGIVLFNFFSEATALGLNSIIGNAGLITKVYIPKYIFPISKVLSSAINLIISMIPLLILMAITGVRFTKALFLIPVVAAFLIVFTIGVSLILSAFTVFFRDVQFLWSVFITMLNFLSPVFYPESIIPASYRMLYHMNPMYQFMYFMRTVTLGGVSPAPVTYFYCLLASLASLALGLFVFRKCQDQFSLYL